MEKIAKEMINTITCLRTPRFRHRMWKGFLLYDFKKCLPKAEIHGIDISKYAVENSKAEIKDRIILGNANNLPWQDNYFDLVISIMFFIVCTHMIF